MILFFIQATPHLSNKRKSLHGRKLRPKSVVDSVEGLSADDIPDLLPSLPKSQAEGLYSLLYCESVKLQNIIIVSQLFQKPSTR